MGDAEQALLAHLATVKEAVADGIGRAPDLNALRNVIGQLFESIELVRLSRGFGTGKGTGDGFGPWVENAVFNDRDEVYALLPKLRWSAVDFPLPGGSAGGDARYVRRVDLPTDPNTFVYGSRNSML